MSSFAFDPANDNLVIATRREIVFIEDNVADIDTLIKGIGNGKEIVVLDSTRDGLHQIAEALAGRSGIDALHIVSHGAAGTLNLGAVTLDANGLEARHDELQAIGQSLRAGGDILLYGCSVGADGAAGQGNGFVEHLAIATGADVAASSNRTGSADLGGDWNLEVSSGQVETAAVVDAKTAALYHGVLATGLQNKTVTFTNYLNFVNPQHTVYDGAAADVIYRVDGNDSYRLVIDGAKDAVAAYEYLINPYVNVAGLPDAQRTENSVSISFTGGKLFTITSLDASRMGAGSGENLLFTGVDSNNQVHTTSATLLGTNAVKKVDFTGFTDIKTLTITTPDNGGVFKFFSLDNLVFSNIQAAPTAPAAPSAPDLTAASDTGSSSTDNYTNKTTGLVFTGTTAAGVTAVKLYEGSTEIASTSVISGTTYTVTTTGSLSAGAHTITAKAVSAGGTSSASSGLAVTVDTTAPANPSAPVLASADDKGASSSDGITSKNALLFSGTAEAGASIKLYDTDGTTQIGSGSADGAGVWNIVTSTLADGSHTVKATAIDAAGNVSALSTGTQVVVDTTAPTLTITSTPSTLIAGETATIRFTFSEDPGASFSWNGSAGDVVVSGGTLSAISGSGMTREATFTPAANTDAGSATIKVPAGAYQDLAGNGNSVASNTLTVNYDTLAPSAPSAPALASSDDAGASNSDGITNDNTLSFSGTATSGTTVKLYDGATQIGAVTASGGTYNIPVAGLAEGSHTLTVKAFDAAGNASTASGALALTVDLTPPTTTVAGAALSNDSGTSNSDMITRFASQTISGTLSANLAAGERVMVSLDNGATWSPATASVGANAWSLDTTLSGSGTLKVKVEDLAGNGGTAYSHAYVLDTTAPGTPSTPDLDAASDSGSSSTDNLTNVTLPSFSGTGEIGSKITLFDGGIEIGSATVGVDGAWHITTSAGTALTERPGDVPHYITSTASDLAGNVSGNNTALEVVVRTSAPTTAIASISLSADTGSSSTDMVTRTAAQTISGTLGTNLVSGEHVQVSLNGGSSWTDATGAVGSNTWSIAATLASGAHDIRVRVMDALDNTGPVLVQAYTLDQVQPTVAITSDVPTLKAGETATITFTFSEDPGSSFSWDGSAGDVTVSGGTLSAISGSGLTRTATFTPAANTNAGTASIGIGAGSYQDLAGNSGLAGSPPSLTFDTLAPSTASTPDLDAGSDKGASSTDDLTNLTSLVFKGTAETGATVRLYDSDGSTEIGSGTATGGNWTIATGTLGAGGHTVTAKVFDAAGNVSAASGATTVTIDTTAPTLVISSNASQLKTGETATITFTFSEDPGASFTWDGAVGDVTVSGGTLSAISGTGTVRTATFTPSANTNGGAASIGVSAGSYRDAAGNDGAAGATPSLHFDTLAPAAPSTPDLDAASDTGSSHTDNFTADTTPTFSGTAESGATVTLYDGAAAIGSVVAAGGTWQITSDRALSAGAHSITAKAVDAAGNAGAASSALAVQIITAGPTTGIKDMALSLDSGTAGDFVTNTAAQTISGLLDAVLAAGERVQVSLDGGTAWNDAVSSTGSDAWSIAATLAAGAHDIRVRVIDAIDNTGPVHTQAYTLDTVKPAVSITSDVAQLKIGETATITFTFSEDPGSSFDATDITVSGGTLSALSGTGTTRSAVFTPAANTNGGTASIGIDAGKYQDLAGNDGTAGASPSLSFDTLAPGAASAPDLDAGSDKGASSTDNLTNLTSLVFKGTAEAGATVRLYDTDGSTEIGSGAATGGNWTIATGTLSAGGHTVTAKVFDAAGNVSSVSGATTVTIDTVKPTLAITSDVSQLKAGQTAAITFTFSEDPGASFDSSDIALSGGTLSALSGSGSTRTAIFTPTADTNGGTASISVIAGAYQDAAGNDGTAGATPSLHFDTLAPAAPAPVLVAGSDTGSSSSDRITNDTTPVFTGTKEAGATVTLYDSDGKVLGTDNSPSGAWSIESPELGEGTHTITAKQTDLAGNVSVLSSGVTVVVDTHADAPAAPLLDPSSDSATKGDGLTGDTTPTLTGSAEAGASVTLYDSDGSTVLGTATADAGGAWSITSSALSAGSHALTVRQVDLAGNASSASAALTLDIDDEALALAAPVLAAASDSGTPGDAITKTTTPTFSGSAEALAQVTLYDGATAIGSIQADAQGAWQITATTLLDGVHAISARQVDLAGNASGVGAVFSLTVDTAAPAAPVAPSLKASSDTGTVGDGVTENTVPVIEGTALAGTLVTLYETIGAGKVKLGAAMADGSGKWSVATAGLSTGLHVLSATQTDAAGNESAASAGFALRIDQPPMPVDLVDGMPVTIIPISLPGNVPGTAVSIPVVDTGRAETSGQIGVADIPLIKSGQGAPILLAQLPAGYGLSASGANLPAANAGELLIAAIKAATPSHAPADQGHLTGNGQSFLAGLGSSGSLLVETVKPVSGAAPSGALTLSGPAPGAGQSTALVIDTGGLGAGATIALQQVNFAAVIGAANVTAGSGVILSGDGASQHFTVAAGGAGSVFAGGGNDILSLAAPAAAGPAPAAGVALLHGGAANDAATFSGARADYNIEFHNGYVMVSTKAAPDVKAMVVNVEQLQFSDASIAVQNSTDMGTLAGIYQTVLGRQADVMGIEYWANVHQAGASWGAIALSIISSSEHVANHEGFNGVAAHDLALLYATIFNREADAGGMAYWTAALGRGLTLEQVASSFVESAEMVGHQRAAADWDFLVG